MKILKILDGFVTNSSSVSAVLLIAVRKERDLGDALQETGLSRDWVNEFENDMEEIIDWFENIEFDDLLDEYDLYLMNYLTASWGDEPYTEYDCDAFWVLAGNILSPIERRRQYNKDLIVLYSSNIM